MVATLMLSKGRQSGAGREFAEGQTIVVGAASDCDIRLQDWLIASRHFTLTHQGKYFEINVLDHLVAVLVNGESVESGRVHHRDIITVGHFEFVLRRQPAVPQQSRRSSPLIRQSAVAPPVRNVSFPAAVPGGRASINGDLFDPSVSVMRVGDVLKERDTAHAVCQIQPVPRQSSDRN